MRFQLLLPIGAALILSTSRSFAAPGADSTLHGGYLVTRVSMCGDCHTPFVESKPDRTRLLEGGPLAFPVAKGMPSVTPRIAGLPPGWTKLQFVRFMETGLGPDGRQARPPMPAYRLNADDAEAVARYLISLGKAHQ